MNKLGDRLKLKASLKMANIHFFQEEMPTKSMRSVLLNTHILNFFLSFSLICLDTFTNQIQIHRQQALEIDSRLKEKRSKAQDDFQKENQEIEERIKVLSNSSKNPITITKTLNLLIYIERTR